MCAILANSCAVFVALAGSCGTLSAIVFALKRSKRVVTLGSGRLGLPVAPAASPTVAVRLVLEPDPGAQ